LDLIGDFKSIDAFIFFDLPNAKNRLVQKALELSAPKYLVLWESEVIKPDNWDVNNHKQFNKIFTWHDSYIDNKKYFKINFAQSFPARIDKGLSNKDKFCVLMAGNKNAAHPLELYTKRLEAIRWFEKNHPDKFDLYGIGWEGYRFISKKLSKKIKENMPFLSGILSPRFPSYRGKVDVKRSVLAKYRFSICYENARDIPGYITEKIFDCFFAGCVPVYWGANNVSDHIPAECFIDKTQFGNYEMLYEYLMHMPDGEYVRYLDAIESYLQSEKAYEFTSRYLSETIIREIVKP
jgi:hypothetical protein